VAPNTARPLVAVPVVATAAGPAVAHGDVPAPRRLLHGSPAVHRWLWSGGGLVGAVVATWVVARHGVRVGVVISAVGSADLRWVGAAAVGSAIIPVLSAHQLALVLPPGVPRRLGLFLAGAFVGKATPGGFGATIARTELLAARGVDRSRALAGLVVGGLCSLPVRAVGFAAAVVVLGADLPVPALPAWVHLGPRQVVVGTALVVGVVAVVRRAGVPEMATAGWARMAVAVRDVAASPARVVAACGCAALAATASAGVLAACLLAVGEPLAPWTVFVVGTGASVVAAVSPTPGHVGASEVALATALGVVGVEPDAALASTVLYRILTFWAPLLAGAVALSSETSRIAQGGWDTAPAESVG
jgi:glycosyltransferase 2 family protein